MQAIILGEIETPVEETLNELLRLAKEDSSPENQQKLSPLLAVMMNLTNQVKLARKDWKALVSGSPSSNF